MAEEKKRTPSARVLAAKILLKQLGEPVKPADELTQEHGTRINTDKRGKILDFHGRIAGKFIERLQNIVAKFEGKPKATGKPFPKKK